MKVIFLASTLPAGFLLSNKNLFLKNLIVYNNEQTYLNFPKEIRKAKTVFFEETLERRNIKKIYSNKNKFIIFHECCWNRLDQLIIENNIETEYYPISSLKSCIDLENENILTIIKVYGFSKKTVKSYLKYKLNKFLYGYSYLYYLMPDDGGNKDFFLIRSMNYSTLKNIQTKKNAYGFYNLTGNPKKSKKIVFLIGNDVIDDNSIIDVFNDLILFCRNNKISFVVKFHPRSKKSFRNKFIIQPNNIYEKQIAFEASNLDYKFKISLFSTSLIFEPHKSISLEKIFEKKIDTRLKNKFLLRKRHLRSFDNFDKILLPDNLNEIYNLLKF